jgi:hypothetical protein
VTSNRYECEPEHEQSGLANTIEKTHTYNSGKNDKTSQKQRTAACASERASSSVAHNGAKAAHREANEVSGATEDGEVEEADTDSICSDVAAVAAAAAAANDDEDEEEDDDNETGTTGADVAPTEAEGLLLELASRFCSNVASKRRLRKIRPC